MIEYPPRPGPRALLLGAVLIASLALLVRPVTDTDFWFHVATGRWIVEHGRLPVHDLFTYTVPGHAWINHEYLSEVALWFLQARFGMAGVSVAFGLLTWIGLLLIVAACRPLSEPYVVVGLATALAAVAGAPVWGPRPQMVTFVLVSLVLLWLRRALEDRVPGRAVPDGRREIWRPGAPDPVAATSSGASASGCVSEQRRSQRRRWGAWAPKIRRPVRNRSASRAILWLPAVMVLWSNLHGGWPIGLLFVGLAIVAEAIRWVNDRDPVRAGRLRRLATAGGLSIVAVGINPNGLAIYAYPFLTLASSAQRTFIGEWSSPNFHLVEARAFEAMALLLVLGLALGRPRAFDLLVALAGLALALESVRHIAIFVAAATPVVVATWSDVWRRYGPQPRPGPGRPPSRWEPILVAAGLVAVTAAVVPRIAGELARQPELTRQIAPVGAADWLAAHPDLGTRMLNEYNWGGYLADRFFPDPHRATFIVQEGVLMGDAQILRYHQVAVLAPGWERVLDQAGVDYVVFDRGSALDDVLATEPGWRLVYRDPTAVIYVRR